MSMDYDNQRALKLFYQLRAELQKSDETGKLKQLNQIIAVLESSFFSKIVGIHKTFEALKNQKDLKPEDILLDSENGLIKIDKSLNNSSKDSKENSLKSKPPKKLPPSQDEFNKILKKMCGTRELLFVQIIKDNISQSLGFSIKFSGSSQMNGIFIEEIVSGTLAERFGIKAQDQILAVDGIPLDDNNFSKEIAIQALKSKQMRIDLFLARDKYKTHLVPSKEKEHKRNKSDIGLSEELDTEWTQYEIIDLTSFSGSFGFGIMANRTSEVMVRNIFPGGAADRDGRLQLNDHIIYINNLPVRHLGSNQVADILKNQSGEVKLIVARRFDQTSNTVNSGKVQMVETVNLDLRLEMIVNQLYPETEIRSSISVSNDLESEKSIKLNANQTIPSMKDDDDVVEFIQVELIRPEKNLGITLTSLINCKDINLDGVYVKHVVKDSVAEKYNIKKYDRILKVNDDCIDIKRMEACINFILNFSPMSFYIQRYESGQTHDILREMDEFADVNIFSSDFPNVNVRNMETPVLTNSSDDSMRSNFEISDSHQRKPLTLEEKLQLITKWKKRIDGNREIIIAEFSKFTEDGGLGISLEGTVDVEDNGLEVHPHHYIRSIVPNGPAGRNGFLRVKDELLEANDMRIYGLNHLDAVNVLKNLPLSVRIIVARSALFTGDDDSIEADDHGQDLDDIFTRETGSDSVYSVKAKSQDNIDDWPLSEGRLSEEASRSRSLDQVQGLAIWDRQINYIDLEKRTNGLGFSVLDYQDPVDPTQSVIIIRSLVPNGAASKDGRIFPGDRLMSVNNIDLSRANMSEAVEALKKTEPGIVRLGIVKALCLESDNYNQNTSPILDNFEDELEDPITECDQVSLFDRFSFANPSWSDTCSQNFDLSNGQSSEICHINNHFEGFDQQDHINLKIPGQISNDWVTFDENGFETITDCNEYENVSSPRLNEENETETDFDDSLISPIPEALEHKIRIQKFSGEKLGINLDCESPYSINENGFVITSIENNSPAYKCNRLSVGDFITKIDNISIRKATETDVKDLLKRIINCSGDIRINFIPEADYQVFIQSRKMQSHFKKNDLSENKRKIESETEPFGFFAKPSAIKASGGQLVFKSQNTEEKELMIISDINKEVEKDDEKILNHDKSSVASLIDLYDACWGEEVTVNVERLNGKEFGIEMVGGFTPEAKSHRLCGYFVRRIYNADEKLKTGDMILEINNISLKDRTSTEIKDLADINANQITLLIRPLLSRNQISNHGSSSSDTTNLQNVQSMNSSKMSTELNSPKPSFVLPTMKLIESTPSASVSSKINNYDIVLDFPLTTEKREKKDEEIMKKENTISISNTSFKDCDNNNIDSSFDFTLGKSQVEEKGKSVESAQQILTKDNMRTGKALESDIENDGEFQTHFPSDNSDDSDKENGGDLNSKRLENKYGDLGGELVLLNIPNPHISKCSLGLKLSGNKDLNHMNIFICQIVPNSIAYIDGRLQVGDEILEVDDHVLFGRSHLNSSPIIKSCLGKMIKFVIHRSSDWQTRMAVPVAIRYAEEIQSNVSSRRNSVVDTLTTSQDQDTSRKASSASLGQIPYIPSISTEETHIVYLTKNAQGLGFAIMEGSFTNESGIYIKHLALQGPAVQDGSLRPGDKIISINYQDVSNASYDTVLELLKNVKSQVRLVVARVRCSKSPSHSAGSPIHNHYSKRLSAPHITALPYYNRPKSPTIDEEKPEQISPGILIKLSPESESGLTSLAKSMTVGDSRRRSSVTNTQSPDIVNVLLNNLEDDDNVESIIIKKGDKALGMSIIGGSDTFIGDVIVHDIFPNGAVSSDQRIKVGDRIMVINDIPVINKTNEELINMLHSPSSEIHLKVRHQDSPIPDQDIYEVVSTVELMKKPSKGLGISVIGREGAKGVFICDVVKGGVASVDGRLKPGDQILEINGEDFRNVNQEYAATRLKILMGLIVFKIGRIQQLKQHYTPAYLIAKDDGDDNPRHLSKDFHNTGHGHSPARSPIASPAHAR